jgi:hypothetical protein
VTVLRGSQRMSATNALVPNSTQACRSSIE